jgi:D-inositol-3-phosphate glycosyltransferase
VCGGPSGTGLEHPTLLVDLAAELGITDIVRFEPPGDRSMLADWYRAADIAVVPSYSESFGLVAVEAQACGTPVVAAAVGGLRTAVLHDTSGVLVEGHDPRDYARVLSSLVSQPSRLAELAHGARMHAASFGWAATTSGLLETYAMALSGRAADAQAAAGQ